MTLRLYITAFVGGLVSMALEMAASRLLDPSSALRTGLGSDHRLILLFLSVGYAVGGGWADRSPHPSSLYTLLIAAGLAIAVIPFITRPVLLIAGQGVAAWNAGQVAGTFIVGLLLLAVPVTLLACVSPFVIRLAMTDVQLSGVTSGKVYAISTIGSFLVPSSLFDCWCPCWATRRLFFPWGVDHRHGALGIWDADGRRFCCGLGPSCDGSAALLKPASFKPQAGLIYEDESAYNFIQVIEKNE
jgi:hypothetical protein